MKEGVAHITHHIMLSDFFDQVHRQAYIFFNLILNMHLHTELIQLLLRLFM